MRLDSIPSQDSPQLTSRVSTTAFANNLQLEHLTWKMLKKRVQTSNAGNITTPAYQALINKFYYRYITVRTFK